MARLQDFQTVTPTSSDKLLVVQSQGQGLVPYGSKLDSANPTGTGNLTMSGDVIINGNKSVGNILQYFGHITFNSSNPAIISKLSSGYGIYIVFGVFAGVSSKTLQIMIGNNAIGSIVDLSTGQAWSSTAYTFSYSSSTGLKIETTVSAASEITFMKSA